MSRWPSTKARRVLAALQRLGWRLKRQGARIGPSNAKAGPTSCSFHDDEELGPRMLARIAKHTGLRPEDL